MYSKSAELVSVRSGDTWADYLKLSVMKISLVVPIA